MASAALVWQIIKGHSAYKVNNGFNHEEFSRDEGNLINRHTPAFVTLGKKQAVNIDFPKRDKKDPKKGTKSPRVKVQFKVPPKHGYISRPRAQWHNISLKGDHAHRHVQLVEKLKEYGVDHRTLSLARTRITRIHKAMLRQSGISLLWSNRKKKNAKHAHAIKKWRKAREAKKKKGVKITKPKLTPEQKLAHKKYVNKKKKEALLKKKKEGTLKKRPTPLVLPQHPRLKLFLRQKKRIAKLVAQRKAAAAKKRVEYEAKRKVEGQAFEKANKEKNKQRHIAKRDERRATKDKIRAELGLPAIKRTGKAAAKGKAPAAVKDAKPKAPKDAKAKAPAKK